MPLSIRNSELENLARELSAQSGKGLTEEILFALRDRKSRLTQSAENRLKRLSALASSVAALPFLDSRSPEEVLGYDQDGSFSDGRR